MTSLLDPTKTPILLWKHPTITSCFTLKIGKEQQLIGFIRTDKAGVNYWKFHKWSPKELTELEKKVKEYEPNSTE